MMGMESTTGPPAALAWIDDTPDGEVHPTLEAAMAASADQVIVVAPNPEGPWSAVAAVRHRHDGRDRWVIDATAPVTVWAGMAASEARARMSAEDSDVLRAHRISAHSVWSVGDIVDLAHACGVAVPPVSLLSRGRVRPDDDRRWIAETGHGGSLTAVATTVTCQGAVSAAHTAIALTRADTVSGWTRHPVLGVLADTARWTPARLDVWALPQQWNPPDAPNEPDWATWVGTVAGLRDLGWGPKAALSYAQRVHGDLARVTCPSCSLSAARHGTGRAEGCGWEI